MAQIGHYTLGAYVDPADPLIRHEAHAIQRLERETRWDLRPAPLPVTEPEIPPAVAPLVTDEPGSPAESPRLAVTTGEQPVTGLPQTLPPPELVPALTPNADGLLDLTLLANQSDSEVNPFAVRDAGPAAFREITLLVSAVAGGPAPCALVNGRTVEAGDIAESLTVAQIEAESVLFRSGTQLIRIPVGPKAVRIRRNLF